MRFFFYGTLLDGSDNPVASSAHRKLVPMGPATTRGLLHAVPDPQGWYPALLPGDGTVHGRLYETTEHFGAADLERLDAYEDCDLLKPQDSLYLRVPVKLATPTRGHCLAKAYLYNRDLPAGSLPIGEGDFRSWLIENAASAFAGRHGG